MTKKADNDEIDLIETFVILWKNKWQVVLILFVTLIITFAYQLITKKDSLSATEVTITSEIKPITVYDEAKYRIYNSFLSILKPNYLRTIKTNQNENILLIEKNSGKRVQSFEIENNYMDGLIVNNINKKFLHDLFIDRFKQKSHLKKTIKNFNFLKKEDYQSNLEYEDAIFETVSSIKILSNKKDISFIQVTTSDIEKWEKFLKFIEGETNTAIQKDLAEMVNNYLDYSQKLKAFAIEDIDIQLMTSVSDQERTILEKMKVAVEADKYTERMKKVYETSPIANSNSFYAAKIVYDSNNYKIKENNQFTIKKTLFIGVVFGLIFGILFVLIGNAVKNRR